MATDENRLIIFQTRWEVNIWEANDE